MALKQDFQQQLQNQLAVWQGQIKEYQERVAQAQASARADYEKAVATLRQNAEQASKLLSQVQQANENAWNDMQLASQRSFAELQKGWADALARFLQE
jgi:hypothetical protein